MTTELDNNEYGFWSSAIAAETVAQASVRLLETAWYKGSAYWSEVRPEEGGRTVVVRQTHSGPKDLLPAPFDARSRVHEYGGGAFCLGDNRCWFVNASDQAVYGVGLDVDSGPQPTQKVFHRPGWRFADLHWDEQRQRVLAVAEVHYPQHIENLLVAITVADGSLEVLQSGADFYAYPRLSPNGEEMSWISWQNPNMPWDSCQLSVAELKPQGELAAVRVVDQGAAIYQPEWCESGRLIWSADHDDWWNLYDSEGQLSHEQAECGAPLWNFAMASWGQAKTAAGDFLVGLFTRDGLTRLLRLTPSGSQVYDLPFTWMEQLRVQGQQALLIAGGADTPSQVITVDLLTGAWECLRQAASLPLADTWLSQPSPIEFATSDAETAHGLYYPPCNPDYKQASGKPASGLPPLVVRCHGGPTSATTTALEMKYQFWTSRGFAVLDVNYRGSSGYGRAYRRSLYGHWGIKDVADAVNGALYLAKQGLVDGNKLFISGSSAGGFTVLSALTFYDVFKAGASYYGIGDLRAIMDDTHKFEARYGDQLIGPYATHEQEYRNRSPLFSAEQLNCPVIFFQGLDDKIVPPNQAQLMVDALIAKGIETKHFEFVGEAHGFRKQDTIVTTLEQELAFYQKVLSTADE